MWRIRIYSILTVPAFGLLYIYTTLIVILLLPLLMLDMTSTVRHIMRFWAVTSFLMIGRRLHTEGYENVNRDRKYILIANHSSLFDIIAIISFFPGLSWFGHERLTRVPIFRSVLKKINYVPMKKSNFRNTKEMINQLVEISKDNTIGIFPEGTRSPDGRLNDFYRGFIILLRSAEIDLLPVTLDGFYALKPKSRFYIGFNSKLRVVIHKPILNSELIRKNDAEIIHTVKAKIESALS